MATEVQRPIISIGPVRWVRKNLFNNWYNSLLTIISLALIARLLVGLVGWLLTANWDPITTRPLLYAVGQYPLDEIWRVGLSVLVVSFLMGLSWATWGNVIGNFDHFTLKGMYLSPVLSQDIHFRLRMIQDAVSYLPGKIKSLSIFL